MSMLLADLVLLVHLALVVFIVGGLAAILWGQFRGWGWVNRLDVRLAHLAAIGIVVLQSWLGQMCPLTLLESWLRVRGGGTGYSRGFIEQWVHAILFYDAPGWVFTLAYTLFGLAVIGTWWRFPPLRGGRPGSRGPAPR